MLVIEYGLYSVKSEKKSKRVQSLQRTKSQEKGGKIQSLQHMKNQEKEDILQSLQELVTRGRVSRDDSELKQNFNYAHNRNFLRYSFS